MLEMIDKQASIKAICDGCFKSRAVDIELKCRSTCNVIDILQQQPTIESEVQHGLWTKDGCEHKYFYYRCSICGVDKDGRTKFCPNCGAKMDKGE